VNSRKSRQRKCVCVVVADRKIIRQEWCIQVAQHVSDIKLRLNSTDAYSTRKHSNLCHLAIKYVKELNEEERKVVRRECEKVLNLKIKTEDLHNVTWYYDN
jgi:hypothetical protein